MWVRLWAFFKIQDGVQDGHQLQGITMVDLFLQPLDRFLVPYLLVPCSTRRLGSFQTAPLADCRELALDNNALPKLLYVFERKNVLMLHIPALWYFDTSEIYPQWFRCSQICCNTTTFVWGPYLWNIALQPAVDCYNKLIYGVRSGSSPGGYSLYEGLLHMLRHFDPLFSGLWKICIVSTLIF